MGSLQVWTKPQGGSEYKQNINEPLIPSAEGENLLLCTEWWHTRKMEIEIKYWFLLNYKAVISPLSVQFWSILEFANNKLDLLLRFRSLYKHVK